MRTKFLSILASFLVLSLAITSCLDSDNEYELSSDNIITAFGLDSIYYGVNYNFTIDQINGLIFNADSVPVSADTIINNILIKTFTTNGYPTAGPNTDGSQDTLFNYTDSLDLSNTMNEPLVIRIRPYDGSAFKTYRIEVRRHLQDPDSLVWWGQEGKQDPYTTSFSNGAVDETKKSKTVYLDNKILVFSADNNGNNPQVYAEEINAIPQNSWSVPTLITPANIDITSVLTFRDKLYTTSSNGKLLSSDNGQNWAEVTFEIPQPIGTDTKIKSLLTTIYDTNRDNPTELYIAGITEATENGISNIARFSSARMIDDKIVWTIGEEVPESFPQENISAIKSYRTATGVQRALLIGKAAETYPWFCEDSGVNWAPMQPATAKSGLPQMDNPSIIYYGKNFYAFGGDFSTIYTSINGIYWESIKQKFLFPYEEGINIFKDRTNYSMTIDENNYIWIVWHKDTSYSDEVWRGKLNRLGFIIQD